MRLTFAVYLLIMYIWCIYASITSMSGICPESKRRYPGDCRVYYRCVVLSIPANATIVSTSNPGVAHAHAWLPTRCTAGLVFEPTLKRCVLPDSDWDCRNDDQIIPIKKFPPTEPSQPEESITEDEAFSTNKMDELNLIIPHVIEITSNAERIDEESEIITDNIDEVMMSSTLKPNSYQLAMTRKPHIPVTVVSSEHRPNVDQIATQMDHIANLTHSLKAVAHTEAFNVSVLSRTTPHRQNAPTESVAMHVTLSQSQIPKPDGLNVIINSPSEPHFELNLLPIQLNKVSGQFESYGKQKLIPLTTQQQTNFNLFGTNVLKRIVEQNAHRHPVTFVDQQNTGRLVSLLFNKYLANKSFVKKNISNSTYVPMYQIPERYDPSITNTEHRDLNILKGMTQIPLSLRTKYDSTSSASATLKPIPATTTTTAQLPIACVSGVRLPNATDCRRYYMCNSSTSAIHSYTCPPYTAFDKVRRMCDVAQYARCVNDDAENSSNIEQVSSTSHLVRVQLPPEEACETRDKLPDPASPRRYVLCIRLYNGRWTRHRMTCPGLLIYCPSRNFCSPKSNCY